MSTLSDHLACVTVMHLERTSDMSTTNQITPSTAHRGPGATVSILTWFLTVTVVLSVIARLGFRFTQLKLRARDDIAICIAGALHIAQCVAVSMEAEAGLGRRRDTLSSDDVLKFEKANYVADVFFIPTLCMAQVSAFFLVESIPASKSVQHAVRYMNIANFTWSIVATVCVVFRSHPPEVWTMPATSINMHVFWIIECVVAILAEIILIIIPFWVIIPLQTSKSKRTTVLVSFSFRVFVIAAIAARIAITPTAATLKADMTRNLAGPVIASQAALCCATVITSIPVLSRFLDQFETGMLRIHEDQATGASVRGTHSSNPLESHKMSTLTSRTHIAAGKKQRFNDSVWEADERADPREMLEPSSDVRRPRRESKSSDTKGILISRSWDCQYEQSEGTSLEDDNPAPVS